MVVFVLDHPGIDAVKGGDVFHKVFVQITQRQGIQAVDITANIGYTQAALFVGPDFAFFFHFFGVDENSFETDDIFAFLLQLDGIDDKQTNGTANLRSSQADSFGVVHGFPHVRDQLAQIFVVWGNIFSFFAQNGMPVSING